MSDIGLDWTPVAPGTPLERARARRTIASQAARLAPGCEVEACRTVLDALGLLDEPAPAKTKTSVAVGRG